MGTPGEGKVDTKNLTRDRSGWGKLPPAKIAKAKSVINKRLPQHYRLQIEAYSKKIAEREEPSK